LCLLIYYLQGEFDDSVKRFGSTIGSNISEPAWYVPIGVEVVAQRHLRAGQGSPAFAYSSLIACTHTHTHTHTRRRETKDQGGERERNDEGDGSSGDDGDFDFWSFVAHRNESVFNGT
jgi:hypothetical protein